MSVTTEQELRIEQLVSELAELLDKEHGVNNEFLHVIVSAVNKHVELIGEA